MELTVGCSSLKKKKKKKNLIRNIYWFPWYKYLYYGQFQQSHNAAKKKRKKETELRVVTCAGGEGKEKWGDVGQRVQTFSYKIDKFLGI